MQKGAIMTQLKEYYYLFTTTTPTMQSSRVEWIYNHPVGEYTYTGHVHPYYELYLYLSGGASFIVNNRLHRLTRGDIVLTRPNQYHNAVRANTENAVHEHFLLKIYLSDPKIIDLFDRLAKKNFLCYSTEVKEKIIDLLFTHINFLRNSGGNTDLFTENAVFANLLNLLKGDTVTAFSDKEYPEILQTALYIIGKEYITLKGSKELADRCYVNQSTLGRQFKKCLNVTPYEYVVSLKMKQACNLLESGKSVTAAAIESGFPDVAHFIALFKKNFGITPLQFKKQSLND